MLIPLRKSGEDRLKRFYGGLGRVVCRRQETTGHARDTVRGIVGMVHTRTAGLDVRVSVRAKLPFHQRANGQQYLSGGETINRPAPECRNRPAAAIDGHDR